jgi:hypothetical protein
VEIDTPQGHNVNGFATLAGLEAVHGPLPATLIAESPSGSRHHYWVYPPGWVIRNNNSTRLGPGIDIRGEGGMVVAPPSQRADGVYRWCNDLPVANAPHWLLRLIVDQPPRARQPVVHANGSIPQALAEMYLATIDPDVHDDAWFTIGCALFTEFGDELGETIWRQWSARGRKYKAQEMPRKWQGIVAHDGYNCTFGTISHFANLAAVDAELLAGLRRGYRNSYAVVPELFGGKK